MDFVHGINMELLNVTCNDIALLNIIIILKSILNIIHIIAPIVLMISIAINISKIVTMDEISKEKKLQKNIINSLIATIILFLLPTIVNLNMSIINNATNSNFNLSSCWEYSNNTSIKTKGAYINKNDNKKNKSTSVYVDQSNYKGKTTTGIGANTTLPITKSTRRIFIGDSRTVQMYVHLFGTWNNSTMSRLARGTLDTRGDIWSCKSGEGLKWMNSTGIPNIEGRISSNTALIILMGVNDLSNVNQYVNYINGKVDTWTSKGAKIYFVSVLPCSGKDIGHNKSINKFNNIIKNNLSSKVTYLDVYSYLFQVGFTTTDGLHYDKKTSQVIYNKILSMV